MLELESSNVVVWNMHTARSDVNISDAQWISNLENKYKIFRVCQDFFDW